VIVEVYLSSVLWADVLASPILVFFASLILALIFFWVGSSKAPKFRPNPEKIASYACGEDVSPIQPRLNVQRFFLYALFFLILDSLAFIVSLSFASPGILPLLFIGVVILPVAIFISALR
jgi:NADH:ubiquinone oxidoreductase subunit 3 (subunit A)